jgi:hypothetical protein
MPPDLDEDEAIAEHAAESTRSGHKTARLAAEILRDSGEGFLIPTAKQRDALLVAFVLAGYVIYGKAFDVVKSSSDVNLDDPDSVSRGIKQKQIVLYEINSTNNPRVTADLRGYFFSLSTAELLVAQNLGELYRFAFVNTRSRSHVEMTLREIFARARGIYPSWSIKF